MRLTPAITAILTAVLLVSHASGEYDGAYCAPRSFNNYEELDAWAKTSTAFGGSLSSLQDGANVIYHAARHWDQRGGSTESAIYRFGGASPGYKLILHLPEQLGFSRQLSVVDGAIAVSRWRENSSDTVRVFLSFEMFPESYGEPHIDRQLLDPPMESEAEVSRDIALDIARVALQADSLKVLTLRLVRERTLGVYWRAVTESRGMPSDAGHAQGQRILGIDAYTGRVVRDENLVTVGAPYGPSRAMVREVAP
jgi:hypothetical protein